MNQGSKNQNAKVKKSTVPKSDHKSNRKALKHSAIYST